MTTALAKAGSLPATSMADLATAGNLLAQASFLGTRSPGEGFLVMATCQQTGMSLIEFQQKYHFRQGRFSMQAHAMLAEFVERGGTYEIIERSPTRAALTLKKDGNSYTSSITWEEALNEPFVYAGKESDQIAALSKPVGERQLKSKYQTPRSRMQMLWARAVSDGVVVVDPGARGGIYTPEETDDFTAPPEPVNITPEEVKARMAEMHAAPVEETAEAEIVEPETEGATPFGGMTENAVPQSGPEVCPVPGPMFGVAWADMTAEVLRYALKLEAPEFTDDHRVAVEEALMEKEK